MATANTNGPIEINSSLLFYQLSIKQRAITYREDNILNNLNGVKYMYCSLCLTEVNKMGLMYEHLEDHSQCGNSRISISIICLLVEEMSSLLIYQMQNLCNIFNIFYENLPYDVGVGISDERFVLVINKGYPSSHTDLTPKVNLADFDILPHKMTNECSVLLLINSDNKNSQCEIFKRNFILYEFNCSVKDTTKYCDKNLNIWNYLTNDVLHLDYVICSCKIVLTFSNFEKHVCKNKCVLLAGILCHTCATLCLFSNGQLLTHIHSIGVKSVKKKIKKRTRRKKKRESMKEEEVEKSGDKSDTSLPEAMLGSLVHVDTPGTVQLLDQFKFYTYCISSNELKETHFSEIEKATYLVCMLCRKICGNNSSLLLHIGTVEHKKQILENIPTTIIHCPDNYQVIICNIEGLKYLEHLVLSEMHPFNCILIGDEEWLQLWFYNYKKPTKVEDSNDLFRDDLKAKICYKSNVKFRIIRLVADGPHNKHIFNLFPKSFIIFEHNSGVEHTSKNKKIKTIGLNKFLSSLGELDILINQRMFLEYTTFIKLVGNRKINFGDDDVGLICYSCKEFIIGSVKRFIMHSHINIDDESGTEMERLEQSSKSLTTKRYLKIVNPVCICNEVNNTNSLTSYLLNALPLNTNIDLLTFSCLICNNWQGSHMQEMFKHTISPSHIKNNKIGIFEEYLCVCDICLAVLIDSGRDVLDNHIKQNHPQFIKTSKPFVIQQDENHITINYISEFSCNLLESYVQRIKDTISLDVNELMVFCMSCLKAFYYNLENFHNHMKSHISKSYIDILAYCKFCNLLLCTSSINWLENHFKYHLHLFTEQNIHASDDVTIFELPPTNETLNNIIFNRVYLFSSSFLDKTIHPNMQYSAFQHFNSVDVTKLFHYLIGKYDNNAALRFYCLHCDIKGTDPDESSKHFVSRLHGLKSLEWNVPVINLIVVCKTCHLILVGKSKPLFLQHFNSENHLYREKITVIEKNESSIEKDVTNERLSLGLISEECESIFSSKTNYDHFVEAKVMEHRRAERGLETIRNSFSTDIKRVIYKFYPDAKIYFFGSRESGLANTQSDVDIFVDIGDDNLNLLVPLFTEMPALFKIKETLFDAKVPIIKMKHRNTGLNCDLSCAKGFGVFNSLLIKVYINLDERVYSLCVTVLEWAAMNKIRGYPKFTSYSITWLVLFFLMQPEIQLIPTVEWLQQRNKMRTLKINEWNCSFLSDIKEIKSEFKPKNGNLTIYELMFKFFIFYAKLNTSAVLIVPYNGSIVQNRWNLNKNKASLNFLIDIIFDKHGKKLISDNNITLIDPFILSSNIVSYVKKERLALFQYYCAHTLKKLSWVNDCLK